MGESDAAEVLALRRAVDVSREGIVVVAPDGHVRFANPAWLAMHGCRTVDHIDEAAFHTEAQLAHDVRALVSELARSGEAQRKVGHKRLDGRLFDTWTSAAPLASGGRVEVIRDLSAEPAPDVSLLLERNVFLDSVIENIPDMVFVKDAEGLRFVRLNRAGEELIGRSREELLGKTDYDVFPRDEADFFTEQDRAALHAGAVVDIREEPIHTENGLRWLHTKKIPIRDERGRPLYLLGIAEDVTARRLADERQRVLAHTSVAMATAPDVEATLESVASAVVPSLADGCCCLCVDAEGARFAAVEHRIHAREPALRQVVTDHLGRRDPAFCEDTSVLGDAVKDIGPSTAETKARARLVLEALGARSVMLVPLRARGRWIGCLALWYDISDARYDARDLEFAEKLAHRVAHDVDNAVLYRDLLRAEGRAKDALRVRDEFLAVASHELRTPLSALQLALQRLDRHKTAHAVGSAELGSMVALAARQVTRLSHLLNSILDVSRILNGRLTLNRERVDFAETVLRAVDLQRETARARGCTLDIRIESSAVGSWDPLRIEQVVTNLLSNAIKYAPHKPIEVHVESTPGGARLIVRDHGPGIRVDSLERIFKKFEQAVPASAYGGVGLGLYISRQIVETHGGSISVSNCADGGARILVELPLAGEVP